MRFDGHDARSDEELVANFQASGNQEFFATLWRRHWLRIHRQCRAFTRDAASAEDLVAGTFTLALRRIDRFENGDFSAWLSVIARNCCIDQARSAWSRLVSLAGEEITALAGHQPDQCCSSEDRMFSAELEQLVNRLPDPQRVAIKLFFIDGYSYDQISGLMQCEVKQVKSHLQNAKRKLQILWSERGQPGEKGAAQ